jgi:hypothetical protein
MNLLTILRNLFRNARTRLHQTAPKAPPEIGIEFEYEWPDTAKTLKAETTHPSTSTTKK